MGKNLRELYKKHLHNYKKYRMRNYSKQRNGDSVCSQAGSWDNQGAGTVI